VDTIDLCVLAGFGGHLLQSQLVAEIAFAAGYLLKGFYVIPDHLPDIGLADDARVLHRIIERNQLESKVETHLTVLQGMAEKTGPRHQSRLNILGCFALLHALRTGKPSNTVDDPSGLNIHTFPPSSRSPDLQLFSWLTADTEKEIDFRPLR
jgi:Protein of unknown function (DUF1232)